MNTRRSLLGAKPAVPSLTWHLMHEPYYALFDPASRERIEDWYNLGASGAQRDVFRDICKAIYAHDKDEVSETVDEDNSSSSSGSATRSGTRGHCGVYGAVAAATEIDVLITNYGGVLSDEGKRRTRAWLRHTATSRRLRDHFRAVFVACQYAYTPRSILHTDYVAPEPRHLRVDRTHFLRAVDWSSPPSQQQQQQEAKATAPAAARPRFTKPRSQFDGVNYLSRVGYGDMPVEEAIAQLRAKHDAHTAAAHYYVDETDYPGCTVCQAGAHTHQGATRAATQQVGAMLRAVVPAPMTAWKPKTCE